MKNHFVQAQYHDQDRRKIILESQVRLLQFWILML